MKSGASFRRVAGFSLIEVIIAIAIIGIAIAALAASQLAAVRNSASSQGVTIAKAEANVLLESLATEVLDVDLIAESPPYDDDGKGNRYWFIDYYWGCPDEPDPSKAPRSITSVECSKVDVPSAGDNVSSAWAIEGQDGIRGEGVLTIVVTSTHVQSGAVVTVGTSITCFEVYPSPTSTAPAPCPEPDPSGGGRG